MLGPGKYDELATYVRTTAHATGGAIVIVIGGNKGDGFSAQLVGPFSTPATVAAVLRDVANQIDPSVN